MKKALLYLIMICGLFTLGACSCGKNKDKGNDDKTQVEKFTIRFMNYDGVILQTDENVEKGTLPSYHSNLPTKPSDEYYDYQFDGWTPVITAANSDAVYLAKFKQVQKEIVIPEDSFSIQWFNYDGSLLKVDYYKEGEMPVYRGEEPTRDSTNEYDFTFKSWLPEVQAVTGNATYMAQFDSQKNYQVVTFDLDEGTSQSYNGGEVKVHGLNQTEFFFDVLKNGYIFKGWAVDDELVMNETGNIVKKIDLTDGLVFKAQYEKKEELILTIQYAFIDSISGKVIKTVNSVDESIAVVSKGGLYPYYSSVHLNCQPGEGYSFGGWMYEEYLLSKEKEYNYKMWDKDITLVALIIVDHYTLTVTSSSHDDGQVRIYNAEQPLKDEYEVEVAAGTLMTISNETYTDCLFLGWFDEDDNLVSADAVYTFVMPAHNYKLISRWNKFKITYDLDGGVVSGDNPEYFSYNEELPKLLEIIAPTKQYSEFNGWIVNGEGEPLQEIYTIYECDIVLKATYILDELFSPYEVEANGDSGFTLTGLKNTSITDIDLSIGITRIATGAFNGATNITSLVIPDTVVEIQEGALSGLVNLEELTIPYVGRSINETELTKESVFTYIFGDTMPSNYSSVSTSTGYDPSIHGYEFKYSSRIPKSLRTINVTGGNIKRLAFNEVSNVTEINVTNVSNIATEAFKECRDLETITIDSTTKTIGQNAFALCGRITTMVLPFIGYDGNTASDGKAYFGYWLFGKLNDYSELRYIYQNDIRVTIPKGAVNLTILGGKLGDHALENTNFSEVHYYGNYIDSWAFTGSEIKEFYAHTKLNYLCSKAFYGCPYLTKVVLQKGVTDLESSIFEDCTQLKTCILNNFDYYLSNDIFKNCTSLVSVQINILQYSSTTITSGVFSNCPKLSKIYIGNTNDHSLSRLTLEDANGTNLHFKNAIKYFHSEDDPGYAGYYWYWDYDGLDIAEW